MFTKNSASSNVAAFWTAQVNSSAMESRDALSRRSSSSESDEDIQVIAEVRAPVQPTRRPYHARRMRVSSESEDDEFLPLSVLPLRREAATKRMVARKTPTRSSSSSSDSEDEEVLAAYWTVPVRQLATERGSLSPSSSSSYSDSEDDVQVIKEVPAAVQASRRPRHARRMRVESSSSDDEEVAPICRPVQPVRRGAPAKRITMTQIPTNEDSSSSDSSSDSSPESDEWDSSDSEEDADDLDPAVEINIKEVPQLPITEGLFKDDSVDLSVKTPLPTIDLATSPAPPVYTIRRPVDPRGFAVPVFLQRRPEVSLKRRMTADVIAELAAKKRKQ